MQNGANLLRSLIKQRSLRLFVYIILHRVSMIVLLFIASCDWETVKTVVPGNSSLKPDQLGSEGKVAEQSLNV